MWQVLRALNYMHKTLKIVHRDIKAENILFKSQDPSDLTVKICDFGFAIRLREDLQQKQLNSFVGSPYYIAPEIFQAEGYDHRCDLWSAGILLYNMLSQGQFPFKGNRAEEIFQNIKKQPLLFDGLIWNSISDSAKDLIRKLLVKCPDARIDILEALKHPFFLMKK